MRRVRRTSTWRPLSCGRWCVLRGRFTPGGGPLDWEMEFWEVTHNFVLYRPPFKSRASAHRPSGPARLRCRDDGGYFQNDFGDRNLVDILMMSKLCSPSWDAHHLESRARNESPLRSTRNCWPRSETWRPRRKSRFQRSRNDSSPWVSHARIATNRRDHEYAERAGTRSSPRGVIAC